MSSFRLETAHGAPSAFHGRELLDDPQPAVIVVEPDRDGIVLGSSQMLALVDAAARAAAGLEMARRRSGGGAVLVERAAMCWFDVVVPADHPTFAAVADDVSASMVWLGGHLVAALAALGVGDTAVHDAPKTRTQWSRLVCFAGTGPGEVVVPDGKLIGISQRRRRLGARFQCMVHTAWNPARLLTVLREPKPDVGELPPVAVLPVDVAGELPRALVDALNR